MIGQLGLRLGETGYGRLRRERCQALMDETYEMYQ